MFDERILADSFWCWVIVFCMIALFIYLMQNIDGMIKEYQRDVFLNEHWEEAEKFIETELNNMGINTVSDLEENEDE